MVIPWNKRIVEGLKKDNISRKLHDGNWNGQPFFETNSSSQENSIYFCIVVTITPQCVVTCSFHYIITVSLPNKHVQTYPVFTLRVCHLYDDCCRECYSVLELISCKSTWHRPLDINKFCHVARIIKISILPVLLYRRCVPHAYH